MALNHKTGVLILLLAIQLQTSVLARYHCSLDNVKIEQLFYNTRSNAFSTKSDQDSTGSEIEIVAAKRCPCDSAWYCILNTTNDVDMCSAGRGNVWFEKDIVDCYKGSNTFTAFLRTLWLPLICIVLIILAMPFATVLGRNASEYVLSPCFPCIRRRRISRMIQSEIDSISNQFSLEASFGRDDGMVEQTVLKLKTKSLNDSNAEGQGGADDVKGGNICLICMGSVGEGEKIGDLSCNHRYHLDCLKEWLRRKNVCPLCNAQVADPLTVLVDRDEFFADDAEEVGEDARNRFNRILTYHNNRTSNRIHASIGW